MFLPTKTSTTTTASRREYRRRFFYLKQHRQRRCMLPTTTSTTTTGLTSNVLNGTTTTTTRKTTTRRRRKEKREERRREKRGNLNSGKKSGKNQIVVCVCTGSQECLNQFNKSLKDTVFLGCGKNIWNSFTRVWKTRFFFWLWHEYLKQFHKGLKDTFFVAVARIFETVSQGSERHCFFFGCGKNIWNSLTRVWKTMFFFAHRGSSLGDFVDGMIPQQQNLLWGL